ncbi:glycosyltransferase [Paenibacillus xylanivorans]|uniref:Glycosyl transferase family 2 n=1 Tax=Paenibacillus xylanivorans TaxID=1705561 RepID=A0A0M9BKQ1_9BACL|nr:glycosyltransferase family 2 protein [Paenibacillus xylanivorans]KOY14300.1 glycosyl transferase family 2 [Paenibacillus xylanivorans]
MGAKPKSAIKKHGVSIIACTKRQSYIRNLFNNYSRQNHSKKELIIIVNNDNIPLTPYLSLAKKLPNVHVYRLPERTSLGACLNYAIKKTKYNYIAKFDDDDYYAPYYLAESVQTFQRTNADVIGKRSHYLYLRGSKDLILRFPHDENRPVTLLPGATLVFKRNVLRNVKFPNRNAGEDDLFCIRSKRKGYKVYSAGRHNFVAIRRKNSSDHTWIISDKELISQSKKIRTGKHYKKFVQKKPKGLS